MFLEKVEKKLYYEVHGNGDQTLIFVHGWMASSAVWREQVSHFAQNMKVITFDLTGYGQSAKPTDIAYTPEIWFKDIDLLIEQLNIRNPILIGWSMGGAIGIGYAVSRPTVLSKLVLVDTTPLLVAPSDVFEHATPPEAAEQLLAALQNDFSSGALSFVEMMFPEPDTESVKNEVHAITQQTTVSIALESVVNAGTFDLRPMLEQIKIPTLIMHGESDVVCAVGAAYCLSEMIPSTQTCIFPGKGHAPFLTDAQQFNKCLAEFIAEVK